MIAIVKRLPVSFCSIVAVLTALTTPQQALSQPDCNVDQLPRDVAGQNRLAVRIDRDWKFFAPADGGPAHVLDAGGLQTLCLAWEAPPYQRRNRQIVYASTQYRPDQPLWLFRNSAAAGIPLVGRLFSNWSRKPDTSGADPNNAFRNFHRSRPDNTAAVPWNKLADWHDTSAWIANRRSYDLVSATAGLTLLPYGTERLLVLAAQRPLTSWVSFVTLSPSGQSQLRVAVSYSGDLEDIEPRVHKYVFEVR